MLVACALLPPGPVCRGASVVLQGKDHVSDQPARVCAPAGSCLLSLSQAALLPCAGGIPGMHPRRNPRQGRVGAGWLRTWANLVWGLRWGLANLPVGWEPRCLLARPWQ